MVTSSSERAELPRGGGDVRFRLLAVLVLVAVSVVFWMGAGTDLRVILVLVAGVAVASLVVALLVGRGRVPAAITLTELGSMIVVLFVLWGLVGEGTEAFTGVLMYVAASVAWRFIVPRAWLRAPKQRG